MANCENSIVLFKGAVSLKEAKIKQQAPRQTAFNISHTVSTYYSCLKLDEVDILVFVREPLAWSLKA